MRLATLQYGTRLALSGLAVALLAAAASAQTPIAHWTFDEGLNDYSITTLTDTQTSGGTTNAVWADDNTNGLSYTGGVIGGAVRLGGTGGDHFNLVWAENPMPEDPQSLPELANTIALASDGSATIGTGITFSAWINSDGAGNSYQGVFMNRDTTDASFDAPDTERTGRNWGLAYRNNTDNFDSRVSNAGLSSVAGDVPMGEWHHIVMTWGADQSTIDDFFVPSVIYLDGVEVGRTNDTATIKFFDSGLWFIGVDSGRNFSGLIDDVAVYDSVLTASQVSTLYTNGTMGRNASGMVTTPVLPGDVNGMNGVDMADFNIILNNLGVAATGRNMGDLDGSKKVDLNDFQLWLDAAPGALHAEAIAALQSIGVPEPSAVILVGCAAFAGGLQGRRRRAA